jgi:ABC-2 type transport system ATP-binding protein
VTQFKELRPHINFIFGGERNLYWRLSAYDNLAYFADLYHVPRSLQKKRIDELLELVGLTEVAKRRVETFSKGMKQRLQIARGLINQPKILFLDEPTIGLDPVSARNLRTILKDLHSQGTTIMLTTHYMQEADELCDRIAFVDKGKIVAMDTPEQLKKISERVSVIECKVAGAAVEEIDQIRFLSQVSHFQCDQKDYIYVIRLHTKTPQELIPALYQTVRNGTITDLSISSPSLEDVYVQIIGGKAS